MDELQIVDVVGNCVALKTLIGDEFRSVYFSDCCSYQSEPNRVARRPILFRERSQNQLEIVAIPPLRSCASASVSGGWGLDRRSLATGNFGWRR